jgi:class 3 adenylate cyclase/tetratricopeptide (TPR) repeat protein
VSRSRPVQAHGERKLVTILFADLSGYTKLAASMDPEEVFGFLRHEILELQRIVEGFGGTVPQVMGDGFMAVFGVPVIRENDAERAVRAALALREHVRALNDDRRGLRFPEVHAGVNSGEVMVAPANEPSGFAVIGDAVNTASRLADLAAGGVVLVDDATKRRTARSIRYGARRVRHAKGKPDLATYEALGIHTDPRTRREGPWTSPVFVDRDLALARVRAELDDAVASGRGRSLLILGEPGAGKSRLAVEVGRRVEATVLAGRCPPFGQRLPLDALAEALGSALGIRPGMPHEEARRRADRFARSSTPREDARAFARRLRLLLGLEVETGRSREFIVEATQAARQAIETIAGARPVLIVLDDLQWADQDLLRFVADMRRSPVEAPALVVGLARAELRLRGVARVELRAMDRDAMRSLVAHVLGPSVAEEVLRPVLSRAEGNPLFLEESVGMLVEGGVLVRDEGDWRIADTERFRAVPTTIRLMIGERLDGLPASDKRVLQDAAVCGDATWDELIAHVSEVPDPARALNSLKRRGLLHRRDDSRFPGAVEYEIKHSLIRDVAYEQLPRAERSRRHFKIAEWLRAQERRTSRQSVAAIAHHYEQSWVLSRSRTGGSGLAPEVPRRAVEYLLRWADEVIVYQARLAAALYERAIRVARDAGDTVASRLKARALIGFGESLVEMGRHDEAETSMSEARRIALASGDRRLEGRALLVAGRLSSDLGRIRAARRLLQRALSLFREEGDARGEAWAHHRLSETWSRTDYRKEIDYLRQAYRLFVRAGDRWGRSVVAQDLAYLLTTEGGEEFDHWYGEAWRLARDEDDLRSRSSILRTWGYVSFYRGENREAVRAVREARPLAVAAGDPYAEADTLLIEASAAHSTSSPQEIEALVRRLLELARLTRSARLQALALLAGVRAPLRSGKPRLSQERLRRALALLRERGIHLEMAEVHLAAAYLHLDRGWFPGVSVEARKAAAVAARNGWILWQPLAPLLEGRASLGAGRVHDASRQFRIAVGRSSELRAMGTMTLASSLLVQAHLLDGREALADELNQSADLDIAATVRESEGIRALHGGDPESALEAFGLAEAARSTMGHTVWLARSLGLAAEAARRMGHRRSASTSERRAEAVLASIGAPTRFRGRALRPLTGVNPHAG